MLCLSTRQPWALWLMIGAKDVENRTWSHPHRGTILLHAGKKADGKDDWDVLSLLEYECMESVREAVARSTPSALKNARQQGCILGKIDIVDCVTESDSPWFETGNEARVGAFGFVVARPHILAEPIPYPGQLGLFVVKDFVLDGAVFL